MTSQQEVANKLNEMLAEIADPSYFEQVLSGLADQAGELTDNAESDIHEAEVALHAAILKAKRAAAAYRLAVWGEATSSIGRDLIEQDETTALARAAIAEFNPPIFDCPDCGQVAVNRDEKCPAFPPCDRCGGAVRHQQERAEVGPDPDAISADHQIIHASCMREGEEIA